MKLILILLICSTSFAEPMTIEQAKQVLLTARNSAKRTPEDVKKATEALKILAGSAFKHE